GPRVPLRPVLVGERDEIALLVDAAAEARRGEADEREEGVGRRRRGLAARGEERREVDRLGAQLGADGLLRVRAVVALAEEDVDRAVDGGEALGHARIVDVEEAPGAAKHLFSAREPLLDRGGRDEERGGDLARGEAGEEVQ